MCFGNLNYEFCLIKLMWEWSLSECDNERAGCVIHFWQMTLWDKINEFLNDFELETHDKGQLSVLARCDLLIVHVVSSRLAWKKNKEEQSSRWVRRSCVCLIFMRIRSTWLHWSSSHSSQSSFIIRSLIR